MSHNVKITGPSIKDMDVLERALTELNEEFGTKFRLERGKNVASRVWMNSRIIPNTVGVIKCDHGSYDITLTEEPNGRIGMQTEALSINEHQAAFKVGSEIKNIETGATHSPGTTGYRRNEDIGMQLALGPIIQRYGTVLTEQQAMAQGYTTQRSFDATTGVMNVVINYN